MTFSSTFVREIRNIDGYCTYLATATAISGDTTGTIDLSSYVQSNLDFALVQGLKADGSAVAITAVDISSSVKQIAITFTNPAANASFKVIAFGR
jgi:hypothetical protein